MNHSETTQPGGNLVNGIPAHDFGKPYTNVENLRSAWFARNTKEAISTFVTALYTSLISTRPINESDITDCIASLRCEVATGEKLLEENEQEHGIPETSNDEMNKMLVVLEKNIINLEKKLHIFPSQHTPADAVISTFSAENKQETT